MYPVVALRMLLDGASKTSNGIAASRLQELTPQHVERDVGGKRAHALAIGGPLYAPHFGAIRRCQAEKNQAPLFPVRPPITGDGQRVVRSRPSPRAFRHRLG